MKEILKYVICFIILIAVYFSLLTITSLIPSGMLKENVSKSADYFLEHGGEKEVVDVRYKEVHLFHFTNALMINNAYSIDSKKPIESWITARKNYIPGVTKTIYTDTPEDLMSASKYYENGVFNGDAYQTLELYDTVNENELYESFEYPRYWHGYLIFLRPLLTTFNYEQITIISFITFAVLLISASYLLTKKKGLLYGIALIVSFIFTDALAVTKSINEIICFNLALIFSIFIMLKEEKSNLPLYFFIFGSITNFLDFLTNPILTYGVPILIYFILEVKNQEISFKDMFLTFLKTSILWALGYLLTWFSKWLLTDIILKRGVIENAINQVKYRTYNEGIKLEDFVFRMKYWLKEETINFMICFGAIINIVNLFTKKYIERTCEHKNIGISIIIPIITGIIPIVWYAVLMQHSYIHYFFTYRNILITFFSACVLMLEISNLVYFKKNIK